MNYVYRQKRLWIVFALMAAIQNAKVCMAQEFNPAEMIGLSVCSVETSKGTSGSYVPSQKNPSTFEYGELTFANNRVVAVFERRGEERCSWYVKGIIDLEKSSLKKRKKRTILRFNCAALNQPYVPTVEYFGLMGLRRLEYDRPIRAWSVDLNTMKISEIKTSNIYCPAFFPD